MTPEERWEMHEQWLHSLDSNLGHVTEKLDRVSDKLDRVSDNLDRVTEKLDRVAGYVVILAEDQVKTRQELRELRELVDRYIRYRGDGNAPAN